MTEELENSLRQSIDTYLAERLRGIDEQLTRLQSEFNDALAALREKSAHEPLDLTPVSEAIVSHLQAAREQKLSGSSEAASPQVAPQVATIKRCVEEIEGQQTHADVLRVLLTSSVQFADRVALFVVRHEQVIGWQECEAGDATNLESIRNVALPLNDATLLGRAALSRSAWSGEPGSNVEDQRLIDQLGGEPKQLAAVPLIVRGKVVAVLYADAASADASAIDSDAIELLARVAAMAINLVSAPSPAQARPASAPPETVDAPMASVPVHEVEPETTSEPESSYQPQVEAAPQVPVQPEVEAAAEPASEAVVTEVEAAEPAAAETIPDSEYVEERPAEVPRAEPAYASSQQEQVVPESTAPIMSEPVMSPTPSEAPAFAGSYSTPLGTARRYGVTEPDLPIEVGDEERRLHNDARRFARLLVSEIKLYNEQKVKEGRSDNNLYERLRDDIDRSRQMYEKRVAPPVAARHDYFHQELVNTLAEGDTAKLGSGYPGASVAMMQ
ncbi:MAG: GAF domain-containing protein [Acidobacteriota bacterium]